MIRCIFLVLILAGMLTGGCGEQPAPVQNAGVKTIILYSELDNKFTENLVNAFNKDNKAKLQLKAVYELKPVGELPDVVLAEQRTLAGLKRQGSLKPVAFADGDRLPQKFRDADLSWYGIFYDPIVFLVNQQYARTVGQANICSWQDLAEKEQLRIALENLSDSNSTQNFLAGLADRFGEDESLEYLGNINRFIGQYSKFPFTPVRMAAVGDADVAITRQSYVFKYLENKFPAYVVYPKEGTPVNLFCVGLFKNTADDLQGLAVMEWLLTSEQVQAIAQENATGYLFLFPRGFDEAAADADKIWLNSSYLEPVKQDSLTNKWLSKVRFSK